MAKDKQKQRSKCQWNAEILFFISFLSHLSFLTQQTSHIAVKLHLPILRAIVFALEGADALQAAGDRALAARTLAEELHDARFLDLLFEALLQTVVALVAVFVGMNSHSRGRVREDFVFRKLFFLCEIVKFS